MRADINNKPCPFCGSRELSYQNKVSYGHGDSTFKGYIECTSCKSQYAYVGNWGTSSHAYEHEAWNKYNGTDIPFNIEDYETAEETNKRKRYKVLLDKYGSKMSLHEFLDYLMLTGEKLE